MISHEKQKSHASENTTNHKHFFSFKKKARSSRGVISSVCSQRGTTKLNMQCHFNGTLLISVLPPLLVTEFVLGILGNGLALWIFSFHMKPWKSSTVLLFNLAVADFLLNMALPFRASYYISELNWKFGSAFCNICLFMLAMNRSGSTIFLMAIAVDRYMRVVHPHHPINSLSVPKAMCGSLVLWMLSISMSAHVFTLKHNKTYCESFMVETQPQLNLSWHKFAFLFSFFIPLVVIIYCTVHIIVHLRRRQLAQQAKIKKALCFITVVAVLFIICFFPSNFMQLLIWARTQRLANSLPASEVCSALENPTSLFYITISLTYLNSALDPVVYYFSSPTFKNFCRKALHLSAEISESTEKRIRETGSQSLSQLWSHSEVKEGSQQPSPQTVMQVQQPTWSYFTYLIYRHYPIYIYCIFLEINCTYKLFSSLCNDCTVLSISFCKTLCISKFLKKKKMLLLLPKINSWLFSCLWPHMNINTNLFFPSCVDSMSLPLLQVIKIFILTTRAASFWIISFAFRLTWSQCKLFEQTYIQITSRVHT